MGRGNNMTDKYSVLYGLLDAIMVVRDDDIVFVNGAMENLLGISQTAVAGTKLSARFGPDNVLSPLIDYVRDSSHRVLDESISLDTFGRDDVGQSKRLLVDVLPIENDELSIMVVVDHRSISGDGVAAYVKEDTTQSLTRVVNMVAHEIKNPLSGIRGAAQLLTADDEFNPMLSLIVRETDRIARLIERLEVLDDVPDGAWEYCNVHAILSDVIETARAGFASHVTFHEQYDPSLPDIWCNRDQMVQVFMNLIKNAAEACPYEETVVTLKTYYDHGARSGLGAVPIVIHVSDNGSGVVGDIAEKIFDPFVKDKKNGTGLGLAVVSKFVANHSGVVDFKNTKQGATFMINLPYARGE